MQTLDELNNVFRKVLKNPDINLKPETTAKDIPEWDSLNHVRLLLEVEKNFKVRFSTAEILQFKNVQDLISGIESKLSGR